MLVTGFGPDRRKDIKIEVKRGCIRILEGRSCGTALWLDRKCSPNGDSRRVFWLLNQDN